MNYQAVVKPMLRSMLAGALLVTGMASAPGVAAAAPIPSYAEPSNETRIVGRIASFDGRYDLVVRDKNGYIDHVRLRRGTVITPTGLTLEAGMVVHIIGYNDGDYFMANEIDTPYKMVTGVPYFGNQIWSSYGVGVPFGFYNTNAYWRTVIAPGYNGYYGQGYGPNYGPGYVPPANWRPGNRSGGAPNEHRNYRYMQERERMQREHQRDEHRANDNRARSERREYRQDGGDRPQSTGQFGLPINGPGNGAGQVGAPGPVGQPQPADGPGMRRRFP